MPKVSKKRWEEINKLAKKAKYLYDVEGYSLRAVAEKVGKSHEWVRGKVGDIMPVDK